MSSGIPDIARKLARRALAPVIALGLMAGKATAQVVLVLSLGAGLSVEAPTAQWRGVGEVHAPFGFTTEVAGKLPTNSATSETSRVLLPSAWAR